MTDRHKFLKLINLSKNDYDFVQIEADRPLFRYEMSHIFSENDVPIKISLFYMIDWYHR